MMESWRRFSLAWLACWLWRILSRIAGGRLRLVGTELAVGLGVGWLARMATVASVGGRMGLGALVVVGPSLGRMEVASGMVLGPMALGLACGTLAWPRTERTAVAVGQPWPVVAHNHMEQRWRWRRMRSIRLSSTFWGFTSKEIQIFFVIKKSCC